MDNLTKWNEAAERALPIAINAKASKETKATAFAALAFLSLQVLASGKAKDEVSLAKAVSKEGKFQALRQCVSNARPLANMLCEGKEIVIENKKEKTSQSFSKEAILSAQEPLFSVASAYKAHRATQEKIVKAMTDDDFMKIAIKAEGDSAPSLASLKTMSKGTQEDYINEGKRLYTEGLKEQAAQAQAYTLESLQNAFLELSEENRKAFTGFVMAFAENDEAQAA